MIDFSFLKSQWIGEYIIRRPPFIYSWLYRRFTNPELLDCTKCEAFWNERQGKILAAAGSTKYYGKGILNIPWSSIPFLEKQVLREKPEDFIVKRLLPAADANTSGSTGTPLRLKRSWGAVITEQVALDLLVSQSGTDLSRSRLAVLRGDNIKSPSDFTPPYWKYKARGRILSFSSNHLCADTYNRYMNALVDFDPEVLWVYPTSLEALTRLSADKKTQLRSLKLILSSSEVLSEGIRNEAAQHFGVPVYDYYGQAERVTMAISTAPGAYTFSPYYGCTELIFVKSDDRFDYYEIIGTSLWNTSQPLLRYKTGDLAKIHRNSPPEQIREIERGLRTFPGIEGRKEDYLVSPDGRHLVGINHIPWGVMNIIQVQVIQTKEDAVDILVVPSNGYSKDTESQLLFRARQKIPETMKISILKVDRLERTAAGKAPFIISRIKKN